MRRRIKFLSAHRLSGDMEVSSSRRILSLSNNEGYPVKFIDMVVELFLLLLCTLHIHNIYPGCRCSMALIAVVMAILSVLVFVQEALANRI